MYYMDNSRMIIMEDTEDIVQYAQNIDFQIMTDGVNVVIMGNFDNYDQSWMTSACQNTGHNLKETAKGSLQKLRVDN